MDALTFIAQIIESLAWPTVALIVALILKREIPTLVRGLRKLKYKDLEAEFDSTAKALDHEADILIPDPKKQIGVEKPDKTAGILKRLEHIAEVAPRSAIIEAWLMVESEAVALIDNLQLASVQSSPGPMRIQAILQKNEVLNEAQAQLFSELRALRNRAVHDSQDSEIGSAAVIAYVGAAAKMAAYLRGWSGKV